MQSRSIKPATREEKRRFEAIVEAGCCACRQAHPDWLRPVEVHHLLDGGVRRGHAFTVALCSWHHRGVPHQGFTQKAATDFFGPSLALDGKAFKKAYGDDESLLRFTELLIRDDQ